MCALQLCRGLIAGLVGWLAPPVVFYFVQCGKGRRSLPARKKVKEKMKCNYGKGEEGGEEKGLSPLTDCLVKVRDSTNKSIYIYKIRNAI